MSLTPAVGSPETSHQVYDMESNQWSPVTDTAENGTPPDWSEPPPPIPMPVTSAGPNPAFFNNIPAPSFISNGAVPYSSNNVNLPFERTGATSNGIYIMNGGRPNILPPGLARPNGFNPVTNGSNGYVNSLANGRFVRGPGWVTTNKVTNSTKKQKRNRTAFTSHQMMELEQEYSRTRYLDRNRRIELSEILNLNQRTIKIWFQNRRMKEKKDRAESLEESEEVSTTESSPEIGSDVPMLIHDQYPLTVTSNEIYNRHDLYMDPYQVIPPPAVMPQQPIQNQVPNDFMEYVPENAYEAPQCRQVHLQVQQYNNVYENDMSEVPQETIQTDSTTSAPNSLPDQSWDLSWIRSLQAEEEF